MKSLVSARVLIQFRRDFCVCLVLLCEIERNVLKARTIKNSLLEVSEILCAQALIQCKIIYNYLMLSTRARVDSTQNNHKQQKRNISYCDLLAIVPCTSAFAPQIAEIFLKHTTRVISNLQCVLTQIRPRLVFNSLLQLRSSSLVFRMLLYLNDQFRQKSHCRQSKISYVCQKL